MFFISAFCLACVFVFNCHSKSDAEETIVDILKKKVIGLDESLTMDIRLLRQDIKKNTEEFNRLSKLLDNALSTLNAGDIQPTRDSQTKQLEVIQGVERAMGRVKRAFAEEKSGLKKFTSTMKTEIDQLSNEIKHGLSDFRISHIEAEKEASNSLQSFKNDLTKDLNDVIADLATNLTSSIEQLSRELAKETSQAVLTMEKASKNIIMVSEIKTSMRDISRNMSENRFETSEQIHQIKEQLVAFDDKFNQISEVLSLVKAKVNVYSYGDARLVNITQTGNLIGGRLEIRYRGNWGTVCDDEFDMNDARVACIMLGLSAVYSFKDKAFYGKGAGYIYLDDLKCSGTESSLYDCRHIGSEDENCSHVEDVGVICNY